ncbi:MULTISPECIES: type II toxin-antitoxin system RelE/ParE family toxin [Halomonas]|uniref:Type II toxin-antitoxin system RelE/ParE family toxin n=1 Tax=Halomonas tibetensis TaxID=2259590 RepID=A0ABV7B633_9GAMM
MRIFKNAWFERFARKQKLEDAALRDAITRAEQGLIDADLGEGVIKQRVARSGQGKSGGYRTIILYQQAHRAFFIYGFAKSQRRNISGDEKAAFKKAAQHILDLSEEHLDEMIRKGQFSEVDDDG